jgi:hypothetical protein
MLQFLKCEGHLQSSTVRIPGHCKTAAATAHHSTGQIAGASSTSIPHLPASNSVLCLSQQPLLVGCCACCRSEKKVLNDINHSKDTEQLRYHVMAAKEGNKIKDRITLAAEKLFILVSTQHSACWTNAHVVVLSELHDACV